MNNSTKILAFAREIAGARTIAPVCSAILKEKWRLLLLAKDRALDVFKDKRLGCINFSRFSIGALEDIIMSELKGLPDLVFISAASLPMIDMTARYLWKWANASGIPTVGVLDHWQNYALRFSGRDEKERLAYLPDYIFVMDKLAKDEMVEEGIPKDKIIITGQPVFDEVLGELALIAPKKYEIRSKLNIEKDSIVVTFATQPLKQCFGDKLGYDEHSTLHFLGSALEKICAIGNKKIYLVIKLHPENKYEEFNWTVSKWPSIRKRIIAEELSPSQTVTISDIVVGMSSFILLQAILANKIVLPLELNALRGAQFVGTRIGATPFIKSITKARGTLNLLLCDKKYREEYLRRQSKWNIKSNGTENCMHVLKKLLIKNRRINEARALRW